MIGRPRRSVVTAAAVLALAALGLLAGCSEDDPLSVSGNNGASVSVDPTDTTVPTDAAPAVTDPADVAPVGSLDWDGVKFDWGEITSAVQRGGRVVITFDRWQWDGVDSPALTEERMVFGNTDFGGTNDSPTLRSYVLSPDVELLRIVNEPNTSPACNDAGRSDPPKWSRFSLTGLENADPDLRSVQTGLTFDAAGEVTRIRISHGC